MLLCLSLNAHRAPLEVRETFALLPEELPDVGLFLRPHVSEAFLLSTCQRFEAYVIPRPGIDAEALGQIFAAYRRADAGKLCSFVQVHRDRAAAEHLFRVVAGLESVVLGEAQIMGQVSRALDAVRLANLVGHRLGSLVQHALAAGRRVRRETTLGQGALSIPRVAVDQAQREIGNLAERTVLLVGAGETAQLAAKAVQGVGRLLVVNRTLDRAEALASQEGGEALPWAQLPAAVAAADLVLCCAGARRPTISREMVAAAQEQRGRRPLLLVDLAVPRGVEPDVSAVPGVRLISLDDLCAQRAAREAERRQQVPKAEAILALEVARAWESWAGVDAHQAIGALRQWAEDVRCQEVKRSSRFLRDLSPEQWAAVELLTGAVVNKLLHRPTMWLRTYPAQAGGALQDLFGIQAVPAPELVGVEGPR